MRQSLNNVDILFSIKYSFQKVWTILDSEDTLDDSFPLQFKLFFYYLMP